MGLQRQPTPNYKAMTPSERLAAYQDHAEAVAVSQDGFAMRPFNPRSRLDAKAWRLMEYAQRERDFIRRVAKSCGDAWAV